MSVVRYGVLSTTPARRTPVGSIEASARCQPGAPDARSRPAGRTSTNRSTRPPRRRERITGELDLEAAGEDDLPPPHDARLEPRVAEAQGDDQRRGTRRGRCVRRLRGRSERNDERCDDGGADHARLQRTSTGVPYVANAYISGASRAIIRMQPCEAGYAGTEPYAWNAIPPTK